MESGIKLGIEQDLEAHVGLNMQRGLRSGLLTLFGNTDIIVPPLTESRMHACVCVG